MTACRPGDRLADLVERLPAERGWAGARVRYVVPGRGFYAAGVVTALQRRNVRFVIPVLRRGAGPTGTARLYRRGTRGWFAHAGRYRGAAVAPAVPHAPTAHPLAPSTG